MNSYPNNVPRITEKNLQAIRHYIEHGNQTGAYRHAYDVENMSDKTIARKAQELFREPHIALRVLEIQKHQSDQFDIKVSDVKRMLWRIAQRCMADRWDSQGNLIPVAPSSSVAALTEFNRMSGFHIKPGESGSQHEGYAPMTPDADDAIEGQFTEVTADKYREARAAMLAQDDC